jgi:hypothetical protein
MRALAGFSLLSRLAAFLPTFSDLSTYPQKGSQLHTQKEVIFLSYLDSIWSASLMHDA